MLIAGLIEARSCERFRAAANHISDRELAEFYGSLFESEARHHSTYVRHGQAVWSRRNSRPPMEELAAAEAAIIERGDDVARMHS